ncbi:translation initiation factor IF-2-like [Lynx rufus]|uniref:translation initiation factor IF-2-like n=1 Tax=Lynx rufus TaxID=61384 RepID=UPI001F125529|nr:translation initiation factor IF-2-like [Lynx rufus]
MLSLPPAFCAGREQASPAERGTCPEPAEDGGGRRQAEATREVTRRPPAGEGSRPLPSAARPVVGPHRGRGVTRRAGRPPWDAAAGGGASAREVVARPAAEGVPGGRASEAGPPHLGSGGGGAGTDEAAAPGGLGSANTKRGGKSLQQIRVKDNCHQILILMSFLLVYLVCRLHSALELRSQYFVLCGFIMHYGQCGTCKLVRSASSRRKMTEAIRKGRRTTLDIEKLARGSQLDRVTLPGDKNNFPEYQPHTSLP